MNFENNPQLKLWLQRIGTAALVSLVIQSVVIYVKHGDLSRFMSISSGIEFTFTSLYFLSLFWLYPKISSFVHSSALDNTSTGLRNFVEGLMVVLSTFFLTGITKLFPMWLLLTVFNAVLDNFNGRFDPDAVRQSLIIHAFLGLFFYYFVERERLRKKIHAEHLKFAQLQRTEFKNQLQNLKNRVNPDFLFKSLQDLDSLIEKNPEKAVEFVGHLSFVYRFFLNEKEELIRLEKELALAEAYISILQMQFGEEVQFSIHKEAKSLSLYVPPGILQMLIENAAAPNRSNLEHSFFVEIKTFQKKLALRITMKKGLQMTSFQEKINLIRERYRYFSNDNVSIKETNQSFEITIPLLNTEKEK